MDSVRRWVGIVKFPEVMDETDEIAFIHEYVPFLNPAIEGVI